MNRRRWIAALAIASAMLALAVLPTTSHAQISAGAPCPPTGFNIGTLCYRADNLGLYMYTGAANNWVQIMSVNALGQLGLGPGGTVLTNGIVKYSQTLTPTATAAAIQTVEQTFTVTGINASDVIFVNGPAPTSLCPLATARASAANTVALGFETLTAAACTPAAGTYNIYAIR